MQPVVLARPVLEKLHVLGVVVRKPYDIHDTRDHALVDRVVVAELVLAPSVPRRADRVRNVGEDAVDHLSRGARLEVLAILAADGLVHAVGLLVGHDVVERNYPRVAREHTRAVLRVLVDRSLEDFGQVALCNLRTLPWIGRATILRVWRAREAAGRVHVLGLQVARALLSLRYA